MRLREDLEHRPLEQRRGRADCVRPPTITATPSRATGRAAVAALALAPVGAGALAWLAFDRIRQAWHRGKW